jgi:dolichol-phosphate mannosyltransferase
MPAYNEEASIEEVVREHVAVLNQLGPAVSQWELVIVDDASSDGTVRILESLRRSIPTLRVVRHESNQGIFAAFARCHAEAKGTHLYSTGSDGQWPADNLFVMLEKVAAGADLVVGVRTNRREVYSVARRIISFAFNSLPKLLFGVAVHDAGSVKLGIREVFDYHLISRSPFFEAERIIRAHAAGLKLEFVPIRFLVRSGGKAKGASWHNIVTSARDMIRCFLVYGRH